ncbi:MAG: hypothetical protein QG673_1068 [Pseudomonadota bacterium]|nr:hypothetical protein [Pseudomonadota bacterium]
MSFINNPDIIDDGKGSVTIKGQRSANDQVQFGSHLSSIYLMMQLGSASSDNTMQFYTHGSNEEGTDGVIRCNNVAAGITIPVQVTKRARLENVSGDNQIATLEDIAQNNPDIYDDGSGNVTIQKPDGSAANLNVSGSVTINTQIDNLPLQISGLGGQFWFYSSGGENNGAVIRGQENQYGIVFTGTDRVRIEGVSGDNRAATMQDIANVTFLQNQGLMNGNIATGFHG